MSSETAHEATARVSVRVNDTDYERDVSVRLSLADFLRGELGLKGTHLGCEQGVCGACTVLLDGQPVRSCLLLAVQADEGEVTTVEGLATDEGLSDLQQSFKKEHGLQCGFCTPGFLMLLAGTAYEIHDREDAREVLSANLCRCTGYRAIVDSAIHSRRSHGNDA
jgi:carbon-monoxide dehydrogenase small subunit